MTHNGPFVLERTATGWLLRLLGDWRLAHLPALDRALAGHAWPEDGGLTLDGSALSGLDSAGLMLIHNRLKAVGIAWSAIELTGFEPGRLELIRLVTGRLATEAPAVESKRGFLSRLGHAISLYAGEIPGLLTLLGQISEGLVGLVRRPTGFRMREFFVQLQAVGLGALPIVAMMTFLVGVVFAYLLGIQIEKYGANIFIVDGVSLAMARELSPMLVAILVAGRSGAAFTAQIGAMKVTEEIDAIATLGLSPVKVLVLPRLFAILVAMPLLAFFGDLMGVLGSATVAATQLDITYHTFFTRMRDVLPLDTVTYGLSKTPAFAAAIAFIACRNGFAVSRDARSVGERTTATVVASLMAVILINALYAILNPVL
ncbi:MAG: ABC transporter permease [Thiobacillus sp.]|nr:ABC transporter permease [Thiobacillus sp.]